MFERLVLEGGVVSHQGDLSSGVPLQTDWTSRLGSAAALQPGFFSRKGASYKYPTTVSGSVMRTF